MIVFSSCLCLLTTEPCELGFEIFIIELGKT